MPGIMKISGEFDPEQFNRAANEIIQRHEAFRTSFHLIDGEPVQKIHKEVDFKITFKESTEEEMELLIEEFVQPFDLEKAPLLRIQVVESDEQSFPLLRYASLFLMGLYGIIYK